MSFRNIDSRYLDYFNVNIHHELLTFLDHL